MTTIKPGIIAPVNSKYIDIYDGKAIVPKGFKVSTKATEQIVANGLVILDKDDNEYVWIPVLDGTLDRKDYGKYWQAGIELTDLSETLPVFLVNSVAKNKGFYIARYEAGIITAQTNTSTTLEDGTVKPLSKPNVNVWNYIPYDSNNSNSDTPTGTGAYKVATLLYPQVDTTVGAVSALIYGAQWDEALKFIATKDSVYPYDSTGKENYTVTLKMTGYYQINNIYDIAGNIFEWTMEDYSISTVLRGGGYNGVEHFVPSGYRSYGDSNVVREYIGFRVALYIK